MKLAIIATCTIASFLLRQANAGAATSCALQRPCFDITVQPVCTAGCAKCGPSDCEYKVCYKVNSAKPGCTKAGDTISHVCMASDCSQRDANNGLIYQTYDEEIIAKAECQIVKGGQIAYLLFKDGNSQGQCGTGALETVNIGSGYSPAQLACAGTETTTSPFNDGTKPFVDTSTCTGNKDGVECIWALKMPPCPTPAPSSVPSEHPSVKPSPCPALVRPKKCYDGFEEFKAGDWVGVTRCGTKISARKRLASTGGYFGPLGNQAMIFDTANPTGNDPDLGTPNQDCTPSGPGIGLGGAPNATGVNCVAQGKAVIISQDGSSVSPNDNAKGGYITFEFSQPVNIKSIGLLDNENGATFQVWDVYGNTRSYNAPKRGDNSFQSVKIGLLYVVKLEALLRGSGAIPFIDLVKVQKPCIV